MRPSAWFGTKPALPGAGFVIPWLSRRVRGGANGGGRPCTSSGM